MICTAIVAYPWFSPAGQQRGVINNAVKLAYNPNTRHKEIVSILRELTPSSQHLASEHSSSVIRLHLVMHLHLTESTSVVCSSLLSKHWKEQHKHNSLNSMMSITRANFRNIVEPYLRDIQAKRGLYGFMVVCDTTNNTPDVIDNNEFRADIFLKTSEVDQLCHPHIRRHPNWRQF